MACGFKSRPGHFVPFRASTPQRVVRFAFAPGLVASLGTSPAPGTMLRLSGYAWRSHVLMKVASMSALQSHRRSMGGRFDFSNFFERKATQRVYLNITPRCS